MSNDPKYMKEYRRNNPDYARQQRQRHSARGKALRALAANHLTEFNALFEKFMGEISGAGTGTAPEELPQRHKQGRIIGP